MKKILVAAAVALFLGTAAFAADLVVDAAFDITGKDISKGYLTVKGTGESVEKDSVDPAKVDAFSGASLKKGTEVWNTYRNGPDKKSTIPGGIQSLVKYPVSPLKQFQADAFTAAKAADGTITIQYIHRGKAYKMVTDKTGKMVLPTGDYKVRTVAVLQADGYNYVAKEFSADNTVAKVDWKKVWDNAIPVSVIAKVKAADGKETEVKSTAVMDDVPASANAYAGVLQVTLVGNIMTVKGELNAKK